MNSQFSPEADGTFAFAPDWHFIQPRRRRKLVRALRDQVKSQDLNLDQRDPSQSSLFENFKLDDVKAIIQDVISKKREDIKARIDEVSSFPEGKRLPELRNEISSHIQINERLQGLR